MLDVPIELARLIPPAELDELVDAICRALGGEIAIYDRAGRLLAGSDLPGHRQPLDHDGERIGAIASAGPNAATALELIATQLGLLVHHANARELAAATHEEAMRMTFAELTEHNQRLQRALARLEELDRLKSNFLATMSHELRTPLTSVIGYAEMMAEGLAGPITGEQHDYLVTILSKADQLLGMITAVLDVASLESAPLALERSALSLSEVVAAEVATYVPQAAKRGISIQVDYRGECTVL
ncbi:MAG TPA: histidine kinase dimerization/phospho-acceptor domain-containing protein, partial [Kofleriaceae bacterium]|nr:histidine kinase dimerization/phospho-acceptor domain-containing protein [Kofleriaceae bacterium]